ncbi:unnamed protein product [Rhizoctonia solani]|uniref:DUF6535 domain-containing protein n=1 Tax=Rhizoctonia solani TaxID=456999 RepID=A0A8H3CYR3_9AGAM|nr:unnamed protein product [Rhizoctonia solani]
MMILRRKWRYYMTKNITLNRGPKLAAATTGSLHAKTTSVSQEEFDEYGAELEPDARVWKTYVKEADKFDKAQVEGWNRSLDVTLFFAALFTIVCTIFVTQSLKLLKEDPAETSTRQLDRIASILLVMAGSPLNSTEDIALDVPKPFSPRSVDLCINILWVFSLVLSATVSFTALLAREWCYLFMSGRTGDQWSQTKRRQQHWEGIEKWQVEQVIRFLPSYIHLALLSFAVGLCIYLGDLDWRIAIPTSILILGSILLYLTSTLLPLFDAGCPYSTAVSRLIQRWGGNNKSAEDEYEETNYFAVKALTWLIKTSEDPKSTDIALQAIAGADPNDANRKLLKDCGADTMISKRLMTLDSYSPSYERTWDLYTRAQRFFQPSPTTSAGVKEIISSSQEAQRDSDAAPPRGSDAAPPRGSDAAPQKGSDAAPQKGSDAAPPRGSDAAPQMGLHRNLQTKIRSLRDIINEQVNVHVTSSEHIFLSTRENIQALQIGRTAASHFLRSLQQGTHTQTLELFDSAIDLLDRYRRSEAHLNPKEIEYLMTGTAMLLCSLLIDCPPEIGGQYVIRLLPTAERAGMRQKQLRVGYLGLPLAVYALSRHDFPGWTHPPPLSRIDRAERAIEVITHYVLYPAELTNVSSSMINLALLELLSDPAGYKLEGSDIVAISESFEPMISDGDQAHIYTFPAHSHPYTFSHTLKSMTTMISKNFNGVFDRQDTTTACLTILNRARMDEPASDAPIGQVYVFLIECILLDVSSGLYGRNTALDLMQRLHGYSGWTQSHILDLAQSLGSREIPSKLKAWTERPVDDTNFIIKLFAVGQAWFLIDLAIESGTAYHQDWRCLGPFVEDEALWDSPGSLTQRLTEQRSILANQYRIMWDSQAHSQHAYLSVLYSSLPQEGEKAGKS